MAKCQKAYMSCSRDQRGLDGGVVKSGQALLGWGGRLWLSLEGKARFRQGKGNGERRILGRKVRVYKMWLGQ